MINDHYLYSSLYNLTEKIVKKIEANEYKDETMMFYTYTQPEFHLDEHGRWSVKEIEHKSSRELSNAAIDDIAKESKEIVEYMIAKAHLKKPIFTDSTGKNEIQPSERDFLFAGCQNGHIFEFVTKYIRKCSKLELDQEIFNFVYSRYEDKITVKRERRCLIVPLNNFTSDVDLILFTDKVTVIKLSREQKNLLAAFMPLLYEYNKIRKTDIETVSRVFASGYAIKVEFDSFDEKNTDVPHPQNQLLSDIVTAFRLTEKVETSVDLVFMMAEDIAGDLVLKMMQFYSPYLYVEQKPVIKVTPTSANDCVEVWKQIQETYKHNDQGKLEIPIRKFNQLYERKILEDKVIDACTLLESTVLYGINDELSYRLGIRGAQLLNDRRNKLETFNILKKLYTLRSNIVHNGERLNHPIQINGSNYSNHEFIDLVEDICRDVMRVYISKISSGISIKAVNEAIENGLLI